MVAKQASDQEILQALQRAVTVLLLAKRSETAAISFTLSSMLGECTKLCGQKAKQLPGLVAHAKLHSYCKAF